MNTAEAILAEDWLTHNAPFDVAKKWLRSGDSTELGEAIKLLRGLSGLFPEVLDIGPELALALIEAKQPEEARLVLQKELDEHSTAREREEYLSRLGRLSRERGDSYVCLDDPSKDKDVPSALRFYHLALQHYQEAHELRHGHYPGINVASLWLTIYAVTPSETRRDDDWLASKTMARELLGRRASWTFEFSDDNIWHLATEADCRLLLKEWEQAKRYYHYAQNEGNHEPFHTNSMRRNVERICACYRRIDQNQDLGPFQDLDEIFPKPQA